jgi:hypothetical protein
MLSPDAERSTVSAKVDSLLSAVITGGLGIRVPGIIARIYVQQLVSRRIGSLGKMAKRHVQALKRRHHRVGPHKSANGQRIGGVDGENAIDDNICMTTLIKAFSPCSQR